MSLHDHRAGVGAPPHPRADAVQTNADRAGSRHGCPDTRLFTRDRGNVEGAAEHLQPLANASQRQTPPRVYLGEKWRLGRGRCVMKRLAPVIFTSLPPATPSGSFGAGAKANMLTGTLAGEAPQQDRPERVDRGSPAQARGLASTYA